VVIYAYNHHVRLLSPEPAVIDKPQLTRVKEPTLLWNQVPKDCPGTLASSKNRGKNSNSPVTFAGPRHPLIRVMLRLLGSRLINSQTGVTYHLEYGLVRRLCLR
jgi:hypothetical protein